MVLICVAILGRTFYIQHVQGSYWRALSDSLHQKYVDLSAERGTIYSEDGNMLSTSVPFFNIYIDFDADGLREKSGKRFKENIDSLSFCLANLFRDQTAAMYKKQLLRGYKEEDRYYLLQRDLNFDQYKQLRNFPLVRQGRNKSGFIIDASSKRMNPFGLLANRTIGLSRDNAQNVGLERTYDSLLHGEDGRRLVRYLNAGTYIPVEGYEIDPENGKDIFTTIDVNTQDIAENALLSMMKQNECEHGTCIVMETATGKIRAMANLGRQSDGNYWEDLNYAIRASEPGSTFKLATLLSLLDDHEIKLTDHLNIEGGHWKVGRRTVHDAERQPNSDVTVQEAFEHSSNVGMAKLVMAHYAQHPQQFVDHLKKLKLNEITGIDLAGETSPIIKSPKSRSWSASTLPWMAFGYEVLISPLQTLTLYNAIANNGRMMKPYLVNSVQYAGGLERQIHPTVVIDKVCSDETLAELKTCLEGVCIKGTAKSIFKDAWYSVAGKTGTALVANGNRGYADHVYQSSFAGYFPVDHPRYTCIVVIKNKPFAKQFLGALVAGPVFREVADKLMSLESSAPNSYQLASYTTMVNKDSVNYSFPGAADAIKNVLLTLQIPYSDSSRNKIWAGVSRENGAPVVRSRNEERKQMPDVKGMGLKDALYLLESRSIAVTTRGTGKVRQQSISAGSAITKYQKLTLDLN